MFAVGARTAAETHRTQYDSSISPPSLFNLGVCKVEVVF